MSLVWAEPFEQYGANLTALVGNAGYSVIKGTTITPGRTGNRCIGFNGFFVGQDGWLTRPLDVAVNRLGQGAAFMPVNVMTASNDFNSAGMRWMSAGGVMECNIGMLSNGAIGVWDRTNTLKGQTPPNLMSVNNWIWVEAQVDVNSGGVGTGRVEVRIQGGAGPRTLIINGINLPNQFAFHGIGGFGSGSQQINFDDWIVWNGLGTSNNTFMGDRRLFLSVPTANGALQDFTASAGSAFNCVNVIPPVDTTYIEGAAAGNVSEFQKTPIGINSTDIAAVVVMGRMFKTDAGVASGRVGINSAGNVVNGVEQFPGTTGQWFFQVQELDPNGNIPWTKLAADNALIRVTRVS